MLIHEVLISFKPDTTNKERVAIYNLYQTLGENCGGKESGIMFWSVKKNLDQRKHVHLVEFAVFKDNDALQAFKVHPEHRKLTAILSQIADWWVGDFEADITIKKKHKE